MWQMEAIKLSDNILHDEKYSVARQLDILTIINYRIYNQERLQEETGVRLSSTPFRPIAYLIDMFIL